ncbi:MAG TPA: response regulator [Rhizomicrobium sp.]|nr:response regulator [Rhizomicrobium sp.]
MPRLLLVEDEFLIALTLESDLKENGYEVVGIAGTADEAERLAGRERPDLVIMDIRLAGPRDGIQAALAIFEQTGIRCVFATAHADAQSKARAQACAPLAWLQKPYGRGTLIETVETALKLLR